MILGISTAVLPYSIAIFEDGLIGMQLLPLGYESLEELDGFISDLLDLHGREMSEVSEVRVVSGPGPYTGIRLGVSVANAFSQGLEVPVRGFHTLEVMASEAGEGTVIAKIGARRGEVNYAVFSCGEAGVVRLSDDLAVSELEFEGVVARFEGTVRVVDSGCLASSLDGLIKPVQDERGFVRPEYSHVVERIA